jgi:hypothetical protein
MRRLCYTATAIVCLASAFGPAPLPGQSIWMEPFRERAVYAEVIKPFFTGNDNMIPTTTTWYLSGRYDFSEKVTFVAEVPFAFAGADTLGGTISDNRLGNPYVGLEVHGEDTPIFGEVGLRLALVPEFQEGDLATASGIFTDWVDRAEAFWPELLSLLLAFNVKNVSRSGVGFRLRAAPVFWVGTGDRDEFEILILYSAQVWYEGGTFDVGGGFSGRVQVTESANTFGERSMHQFVVAADVRNGIVRPGLQVRVPVDDGYSSLLAWGLDLYLEVGPN